ncbi:DNA adenine methylase [Chitinibacter sp. FCG-7]|uniref:DNA adenine methylase n=1 Tax=Chitinibacter mangrovi TaxID=3153927 RepID=A0AAU7F6R5_9NEIS
MAGHSKPLTPLRYPGGKGAFAPFIKSIIECNKLKGGHYLEPFAGGAGVALDLLFNDYSQEIHINDLDPAIYSFWHAIVNTSKDFLDLLSSTPISINEWHKQKQIINAPHCHSTLELGFAAFFLNRTNRSGILKGGVIGGKKQDGIYKLCARFNKEKLAARIRKISAHASQIHVYNQNAVDLINKVTDFIPENSLIYLDPPYYNKGQGLYRNFYTHDDHVSICRALAKIDRKWIVSYDSCIQIKDIYSIYRQDEYALSYCAYKKTKGAEIMIYGPTVLEPIESQLKTHSP